MKHKMWSRLLSMALAVMMIASIVPNSAFAEAGSELAASSQVVTEMVEGTEEVTQPEETTGEEPAEQPAGETASDEEPVAEPSTEPAVESEQPTTEPTQAPAETAVSSEQPSAEPSAAPEGTQTPEGTEAPEGTAVPSETPAASATPAPSESPVPSETPAPSEEPAIDGQALLDELMAIEDDEAFLKAVSELTEEQTAALEALGEEALAEYNARLTALNDEEIKNEETLLNNEYTAEVLDETGNRVAVVTVEAQEGVIPEEASLKADLLTGEAGEEAAAELDEAGVVYDGYMALDIRFEDAEGNEVEPQGEVRVVMLAPAALSEDVDPNTLAVQHHVEDADGNVTVEEVASATPVTMAAASLPSDEETGVIASGSDVTAVFDVNGFSSFTITWINYFKVTVHYVDESGEAISGPQSEEITISDNYNNNTVEFKDYAGDIEGYSFVEARYDNKVVTKVVANKEDGWIGDTRTLTFYNGNSKIDQIEDGWSTRTADVYLVYGVSGPIRIEDRIQSEGILKAVVDEGIDTQDLTYTWYRNDDQQVTPVKVTGDQYNTESGADWVNVALDIESLCMNVNDATKNEIRSAEYSYTVVVTNSSNKEIGSATYKVPYYAQLMNGSFEQPEAPSNNYQPYYSNGTEGLYWQTTASDGKIEFVSVKTTNFQNSSWEHHKTRTAGDGVQFAELNGNMPGTLYQDVLTVPGSTLFWQLEHRGRDVKANTTNKDTMYVLITSTETAQEITTQDDVDKIVVEWKNANEPVDYNGIRIVEISDDNRDWYQSEGQYVVPSNQYLTRFFFAAGETAYDSSSQADPNLKGTVGNHLDDVWFSPSLPKPSEDKANLVVTKVLDGVADLDKDKAEFSFEVKDSEDKVVESFKLNLASGWSKAFKDLEPGQYTITEVTDPSTVLGDLGYVYMDTSATGAQALESKLTYQVTLEAGENAEVTVTNRYEAKPINPPSGETVPDHSKKAISNNDGTYDLSLSVNGDVIAQGGDKVPVDVLFIVDRSGSMKEEISKEDSTKRITAVRSAVEQLVKTITANDNISARFSTVAFAGLKEEWARDHIWEDWYLYDAGTSILTPWPSDSTTNNGSTAVNELKNMDVVGGTNYQAGIYYGKQQLRKVRDGANTVVIFLSDGLPTYRGTSTQQGDGQHDDGGVNITAAVNEISTMSSTAFYAVGIGPDFVEGETGYDNLVSLKNNAKANQKNVYSAQNTTELNKAFADIASDLTYKAYSDVTIEDTLSDYVDVVMSGNTPAGFSIVVKDKDGKPVGNSVVDGNTVTLELPKTEMNKAAALKATYNPSEKTVTLDFPTDYLLENKWTYEVHITVKANEAAEAAYADAGYTYTNAEGAGKADEGTGTHEGEEGFYSNDSATLTYTNQEEGRRQVSYDKPVVQLQTAPIIVTKTFANLSADQVPADSFKLEVKNSDNKIKTLTLTGAANTQSWTLNLPLGSYTFTESGYAPAADSGKLMDSVTVDGITGNPEVPAGNTAITLGNLNVNDTASKTVNVTNTYVDANGDLVITKKLKDMNKSMGDDATFQFKITNNDTGMVWYRYLTFTEAGTRTIELKDIPAGNYTVQEMSSLGYELEADCSDTVSTIVSYKVAGSAQFVNKSTGGNTPGDQDIVRNNFHYDSQKEQWVFEQAK